MDEQPARAQPSYCAQQLARLPTSLSFTLPLRALALPRSISMSTDRPIALAEETITVGGIVGTHPSVVGDGARLADRPRRIAVSIMLRAFT